MPVFIGRNYNVRSSIIGFKGKYNKYEVCIAGKQNPAEYLNNNGIHYRCLKQLIILCFWSHSSVRTMFIISIYQRFLEKLINTKNVNMELVLKVVKNVPTAVF
jgi:hypothetical protein